jgi:hypothetical protein
LLGASYLHDVPSARQLRAETAVAQWARFRLPSRTIETRCPEDSSLHAGARYVCGIETKGGVVAHVPVAIESGGRARRHLRVVAFRKRAIVEDLRRSYRSFRKGGGYGLAEVSCPQTVSARPGTKFRCSARFTDAIEGTIAGRIRGRHGGFDWREVGTTMSGQGSARA